jgi:hypothetical protein
MEQDRGTFKVKIRRIRASVYKVARKALLSLAPERRRKREKELPVI